MAENEDQNSKKHEDTNSEEDKDKNKKNQKDNKFNEKLAYYSNAFDFGGLNPRKRKK